MTEVTPTVSDIANHLSGIVEGPDQPVTGLSPLTAPSTGTLTFVNDSLASAESVAIALRVGAIILFPADAISPRLDDGTIIRVQNPRAAFASVVQRFFSPVVEPGIAATAAVHPTATVANSAHIGEFSVIGPDVVVGDYSEVRNHVVLAAKVSIGGHCLIKSHAVIGEEGFGIDKDRNGNNVRLPHLGSVVIGDYVEVGAFSTVCSGTISPTTVDHHTKIDDHVHISHNCRVGSNVTITACAEISGSVQIGDGAWIGPNASILQGLTISANALIGIGAVVTKSADASQVYFGNPARRIRDNV